MSERAPDHGPEDASLRLTVVVWSVLSVGVAAMPVLAQTRSETPPALTIESLTGMDTFVAYCAPCHGRAGAGDGPVAPALRTRPADFEAPFVTATRSSFDRTAGWTVGHPTGIGKRRHRSADVQEGNRRVVAAGKSHGVMEGALRAVREIDRAEDVTDIDHGMPR